MNEIVLTFESMVDKVKASDVTINAPKGVSAVVQADGNGYLEVITIVAPISVCCLSDKANINVYQGPEVECEEHGIKVSW